MSATDLTGPFQEVVKPFFGEHIVKNGRRRALSRLFSMLLVLSPIAIFSSWSDGGAHLRWGALLVLCLAGLWLSVRLGMSRVKKVRISELGISFDPIALHIAASDIEVVSIDGKGNATILMEVTLRKHGFQFYIGSLIWVGNRVTFFV